MKKTILFFLLITGTGNLLHAQLRDLPTRSESLFDNPPPGKSNARFQFYLPNNKRILLEFAYVSQVDRLQNLDSMVKIAAAILEPLKDSLKSDGMVRRVDIVLTNSVPKIRIISHTQFSNTYTIKDNELMQLKVNQDTVRIIGYTTSRARWNVIDSSGMATMQDVSSPFSLILILNNVADITTLEPDALAKCIATLKPQIEDFYKRDKDYSSIYEYRASFNMKTGHMFSPAYKRYIATGDSRFSPVLGFSLVAARGSIVPSIQGGIAYNRSNKYYQNSFRFYVEAESFFSRDADNKLTINKNMFGTFQFVQTEKRLTGNGLALTGSATLGYLFSRSGNWYEPNTWKFGLPILKSKHISIEPQFIFNGWFKNVSPSIKLTFNF